LLLFYWPLTVGEDLWELDWPGSQGKGVRVARHDGASEGLWFVGSSGEHRWFSDSTHWFCGETRVPFQEAYVWAIGADGFYVIKKDKTWQLIPPQGGIAKQGSIETDLVLLLQVQRQGPWVALRTGDVRQMDNTVEGAFRVRLPR
jgi:hypothetical protein